MPRRAAVSLALPDGAPSKVASRASARWLAAFGTVLNGNRQARRGRFFWLSTIFSENRSALFHITAATASQKSGMAVLILFFTFGMVLLMRVEEPTPTVVPAKRSAGRDP